MVVHLFLNNNKALDFLPINSIKNGGITIGKPLKPMLYNGSILDEKEVFNLIELIFDRHTV